MDTREEKVKSRGKLYIVSAPYSKVRYTEEDICHVSDITLSVVNCTYAIMAGTTVFVCYSRISSQSSLLNCKIC